MSNSKKQSDLRVQFPVFGFCTHFTSLTYKLGPTKYILIDYNLEICQKMALDLYRGRDIQ